LKTYAITSWWCRMHSFNFACKSQCATVWNCSYSRPLWGAVCCCLISNKAAFSLSNWAQATAVRVINKDGKPMATPDSNNAAKHCKEINNYNADIWFIQIREDCITCDNICYSSCWISAVTAKWFHSMNINTKLFECDVCFRIECGKTWMWYGTAWRLFLIYFLSSCF